MAGFNVLAPNMRTNYLAFASILIALALLVASMYYLYILIRSRAKIEGVAAYLALALLFFYLLHVFVAILWRWKFTLCLNTVASAIETFKPQAIVASSFGGAVTVELMRTGVWSGPTVLLSPAVDIIHRLLRRGGELPIIPDGMTVTIVHGQQDFIAPYTDSLRLHRDSDTHGEFIDAGSDGHLLFSWNDPQDMKELVLNTIATSRRRRGTRRPSAVTRGAVAAKEDSTVRTTAVC
eukprot:CAMPEP_0167797094 /NCGR_PEP_ID=MMETSP0111_2-20121227/15441_1 /TAXON_ID=91324 /ORGANISM="Lotharella globosa, Strain CCCM811" /LENGTH=235 /DNA_ID=CAMNT_0007691117 /DNA_START=114 /DNA_END=821 /DNA_ORIENTATION=+